VPDVGGDRQIELTGPAPDRFAGDVDATRGQKLFHIPETGVSCRMSVALVPLSETSCH